MKRALSTIMTVMMIAGTLLSVFSCSTAQSEEETKPVQSAPSPEETEAEVETKLEDLIPEDLRGRDFGGETFTFIKWSEGGAWDLTEFAAEELNGELLNDEVYTRNVLVEDKFNVSIKSENNSGPVARIEKMVKAGDSTYQVVTDWPSRMASTSSSGTLLDFFKIPSVDLDAVWWDHNAANSYTIFGKMYFTTGDVLLFDKQRVFCMIFNRTLADMLGIPNLYDTVRSGEWTIDLFNAYCELAPADLNGDGMLGSLDDRFGFISGSTTAMPYLLFGLGNSYSAPDDEGNLTLALMNEHTVNSIEKLGKTIFNKELTVHNEEIYPKIGINDREFFQQRRGLFNYTVTHVLRLMEMDDAYGIIPQPKYDEQQKAYITCGQGDWSAALGVPSSLNESQIEMTGVLLEAMSALSHQTTYPAFVDTILMAKKSPDEESTEMLRLIYSNILYDLFDIFKIGGVDSVLCNCLYQNAGENFISSIESIQKRVDKEFERLMRKYEGLE